MIESYDCGRNVIIRLFAVEFASPKMAKVTITTNKTVTAMTGTPITTGKNSE